MTAAARLSLYPPPETDDDRYAWGCAVGGAIAGARDHGTVTELTGKDSSVIARIMPPPDPGNG